MAKAKAKIGRANTGSLLSRLVGKLKGILAGWEPDDPSLPRATMRGVSVSRETFPVPELLLLLAQLAGFPVSGHEEKTRWTIHARFLGEPVKISLRKFGLRVEAGSTAAGESKRLIGQLSNALRILEQKLVGPLVEQQLKENNVSIENRFGEFDSRYRFFRDKALAAFHRRVRKPKSDRRGIPNFAEILNAEHRKSREGFFHSTAMVDAFFSRLEHRLILLRAFSGRPMADGELDSFLAKRWDEKLAEVVDMGTSNAQDLMGRLRSVKERIRNPFSHGGIENDRASIFAHVPRIGAVPMSMSRFRNSVRFKLFAVEKDDHKTLGALFDEVDQLLEGGALKIPNTLLVAGVDPSYDKRSLKTYLALAKSEKKTELYLRRWSEEADMHANMDY